MKLFSLFYVLIFACTSLSAQVKDTSHILKRPSEFSLFSSDDTLTRNDYLLSIEKVFAGTANFYQMLISNGSYAR